LSEVSSQIVVARGMRIFYTGMLYSNLIWHWTSASDPTFSGRFRKRRRIPEIDIKLAALNLETRRPVYRTFLMLLKKENSLWCK